MQTARMLQTRTRRCPMPDHFQTQCDQRVECPDRLAFPLAHYQLEY